MYFKKRKYDEKEVGKCERRKQTLRYIFRDETKSQEITENCMIKSCIFRMFIKSYVRYVKVIRMGWTCRNREKYYGKCIKMNMMGGTQKGMKDLINE